MEIIETDYNINEITINEFKEKYPYFKIINSREGEVLNNLKGFLYNKRYREFDANFYINFIPDIFLGVNIYNKDQFQYSISTNSGEWKEKLDYLEKIVDKIDEKGFSSVRSKFNSGNLIMSFNEF